MAFSYERRNQLAREQGFASYYDKRRTTEYANRSPSFRNIIGRAGGQRRENFDDARLFFQAFKLSPKDDYSVHRNRRGELTVTRTGRGAKAKWLIEKARYVENYDEWLALYPEGTRARE